MISPALHGLVPRQGAHLTAAAALAGVCTEGTGTQPVCGLFPCLSSTHLPAATSKCLCRAGCADARGTIMLWVLGAGRHWGIMGGGCHIFAIFLIGWAFLWQAGLPGLGGCSEVHVRGLICIALIIPNKPVLSTCKYSICVTLLCFM